MDIKAIKETLKPLIKECIKEVLMEEGLGKMLSESKTAEQSAPKKQVIKQEPISESNQQLENRKKLASEIGKSGYLNTKFDPFSGTKALTESQASGTGAAKDLSDPGIDVGNLISGNKNVWKTLVNGKAK